MGCASSSAEDPGPPPASASDVYITVGDDAPRASSSTTRRMFYASKSAYSMGPVRPVCKHGTKCYRRNPEHLEEEAHPADPDYLRCCREAGVDPEFVSIRKLFEWCDPNCTGKAKRAEVEKVWDTMKCLGEDVPEMSDELWHSLDEDGNGHMNFSEFAEFTTLHKVGLPLGLDELFGTGDLDKGDLRCGVHSCQCRKFTVRKRRCRYGTQCYQKKADHLEAFSHPDDDDWEFCKEASDPHMCTCGHKKKLHSSSHVAAGAVPYPSYWTSKVDGDTEFNHLVPVEEEDVARFQKLLDATYSNVTTRDRVNHTGTWMVPKSFTLKSVCRNENSRLWRKYEVRKAELMNEREALDMNASGELEDYEQYTDVKTTEAWESLLADELEDSINEWYLFHGTSASAALNICSSDFKMRLAGSATGTLYGRGSYLAESITKADEYAKDERSTYTVLLCRVLGGRVRYCDEKTPDAEKLTNDCVEGPYDCILGDRTKTSGTYREFVFFDTENLYPEYVLKYERGELFKSPSYPGHH
eukprot:CAMPEP_0175642988 /NCGR_PEP_ID=MMETSP0097-20121207/5558_1 /TAXON_ID=311494 /ORGANISM="Alexandrium monilatum, Strain CCMP3105" /LENGTH=526 /DNA_ID=CAMNT_0016948809 /DNA_START=66 /DNA_END=1646 /DNA_ORIENTATION=+